MVQEEQTGSTQVQGRVELVHDDEMMDVDDVVAGVHCDALEDDEVRHDDQESVMEEAVEQVEVSHDNTVLEDNDVDNALDDHIDEVSHSVVSGVSISSHKLYLIEYQTVSCLANVVKIPKSDGFISRHRY